MLSHPVIVFYKSIQKRWSCIWLHGTWVGGTWEGGGPFQLRIFFSLRLYLYRCAFGPDDLRTDSDPNRLDEFMPGLLRVSSSPGFNSIRSESLGWILGLWPSHPNWTVAREMMKSSDFDDRSSSLHTDRMMEIKKALTLGGLLPGSMTTNLCSECIWTWSGMQAIMNMFKHNTKDRSWIVRPSIVGHEGRRVHAKQSWGLKNAMLRKINNNNNNKLKERLVPNTCALWAHGCDGKSKCKLNNLVKYVWNDDKI